MRSDGHDPLRTEPAAERNILRKVTGAFGYGVGPRAALGFGVVCYMLGALLLKPVIERRRELDPTQLDLGA